MKKTNRTFKRFAAITSASLLAACAVMPAVTSALDFTLTDPKVEVNEELVSTLPEGAVIQENVSAYQVFTLTKVDDLYNVTGWGTGVNSAGLIAAITDADNTDFNVGTPAANAFAGITATDTESAQKVGDALSKLDDEQQEAFAKAVMNNLSASATATGKYSSSTNKVTFETINNGYYIMSCEVKKDSEDTYTSESLGMLTVVDNAIVNGSIGENGQAKVGLPTVEKKVKEDQSSNYAEALATHETSDKSWNDVADYDIGDAVSFKLYGTMPDNLDKYDAYYYCFKDTLDSQFNSAENVVVKIDGTVVSEGDNMDITVDGQNLTVSFKDIKTAAEGVTKDSIVTVEYTAVLNTSAVVGNPGQNNKVYLEYSNNPNFDYNPWDDSTENDTPDEIGETPKDIVNVLTYAFELEKTFFNAAGGPLTVEELEEGTYGEATFALTSTDKELCFAEYDGEGYDYVVVKPGTEGAITELKLTEVDGELLIRIKGLDEGTYTLTETNAPEGFNTAPAQTIVITADTANGQAWDGTTKNLEGFSWTIDGEEAGNQTGAAIDATATAEMQNKKGTSLPSTGGIGTTIFYLGGGAMAAIGGVYLISKRRMKKSEE